MKQFPTLAALAAAMLAGTAAHAATAVQTAPAGSGTAFGTMQAGLVVNHVINVQGLFPQRYSAPVGEFGAYGVGTGEEVVGSISLFAGSFAPAGTAFANGRTLQAAQNILPFAVMGCTFGCPTDTSFNLPDLQGRAMVGAVPFGFGSIGSVAGRERATLSVENLPAHTHGLPDGQTTGSAGRAQPAAVRTETPSLAITYLIQTSGSFPSTSGGGRTDGMIGQIGAFTGNFVPVGFAAADGSLLNISENQALYQILGTTYGGDGINNFALPDLRGRAAVGVDSSQNIGLGSVFGSVATTLTAANLPAHDHDLAGGGTTGLTGGGAAFSTVGPSLGLRYIIATNGLFPVRNDLPIDEAGNLLAYDADATIGQISLFAGNFAPAGWMLAEGQTLRVTQNQALFTVVGCAYGCTFENERTVTFNLPDFRGRTAYGPGQSNFGTNYRVGQVVGANSVTLTEANLPSHSHSVPAAVTSDAPEPATWGMMILGFGLVGAAARRRRQRVVAA